MRYKSSSHWNAQRELHAGLRNCYMKLAQTNTGVSSTEYIRQISVTSDRHDEFHVCGPVWCMPDELQVSKCYCWMCCKAHNGKLGVRCLQHEWAHRQDGFINF